MEDKMELIERYLHETGKYLAKKNREDILAEIRSHLEDTLDERTGGKPTEEDVVALLKETGSPRKMAASYAPHRQYMVGPELYPLFRMVVGIAILAVIGAQTLAWVVSLALGEGELHAGSVFSGLLLSVPSTIGWIVIVFMILQAAGVKADTDEKWDPKSLPEIKDEPEVKRSESVAGIIFGFLFLAIILVMPDKIGLYNFNDHEFFANPVIQQYLPLIGLSLLVSIGLNIFLLWQGHHNIITRVYQFASNIFSIVVLTFLYKGHNAWLADNGSGGFFPQIVKLGENYGENINLIGMEAFRLAFGIALVVTVIETIVIIVKMIVSSLRAGRVVDLSTK
jgi:hypothetical protein